MAYAFNNDKSKAEIVQVTGSQSITLGAGGTTIYRLSEVAADLASVIGVAECGCTDNYLLVAGFWLVQNSFGSVDLLAKIHNPSSSSRTGTIKCRVTSFSDADA